MKKFRMKRKPLKPILRKKLTGYISLDDGVSIIDILYELKKSQVPPSSAKVSVGYCSDYDPAPQIVWSRLETDEEFGARLQQYNKEYSEWWKWYDKNREAVDKYENDQKEKKRKRKEDKKNKELSEEKKQMEEAIKFLRKKGIKI